jgi:aquaporin Z
MSSLPSPSQPTCLPQTQAVVRHWPEYGAEALSLGLFMVSAGAFATLLEAPQYGLRQLMPSDALRRVLAGVAMGLTAIGLIYSPWGKRSGAHMNPAVTLAFWRLGKIRSADATFYILAQFFGGLLGVLLVIATFGEAFRSAPVNYVVTLPGPPGVGIAFAAEVVISCGMMSAILWIAENRSWMRFTGLVAGLLVAAYIALEAPLSGMSMNPARSFASAAPAGVWQHLWIYFTAPPLGMLLATQFHLAWHGAGFRGCAKLIHDEGMRCIHCGHEPQSQPHGSRS